MPKVNYLKVLGSKKNKGPTKDIKTRLWSPGPDRGRILVLICKLFKIVKKSECEHMSAEKQSGYCFNHDTKL